MYVFSCNVICVKFGQLSNKLFKNTPISSKTIWLLFNIIASNVGFVILFGIFEILL